MAAGVAAGGVGRNVSGALSSAGAAGGEAAMIKDGCRGGCEASTNDLRGSQGGRGRAVTGGDGGTACGADKGQAGAGQEGDGMRGGNGGPWLPDPPNVSGACCAMDHFVQTYAVIVRANLAAHTTVQHTHRRSTCVHQHKPATTHPAHMCKHAYTSTHCMRMQPAGGHDMCVLGAMGTYFTHAPSPPPTHTHHAHTPCRWPPRVRAWVPWAHTMRMITPLMSPI